MSHPARKPPRRSPPDAWARIRSDYAAGVPARIAAERGGVSLSALRTRARQEGWRRQDGCGPPPPADWTPDLEAGLESDPALLAAEAWLNAARFIQLGRLSEGSAWARMAAHCRRAARDAAAEVHREYAALQTLIRVCAPDPGAEPTEADDQLRRTVIARVMEGLDALEGPSAAAAAPPECKSQAPEPAKLSAALHPLHTPPPPTASPVPDGPPSPPAPRLRMTWNPP